MKRTDRRSVQIATGIGNGQRGVRVEPDLVPYNHRRAGIRSIAIVGKIERCRSLDR